MSMPIITGFLNINKEMGVSSAREVAIVKRLTGIASGHMGTLDPMASGVLPIGVGNATRLFDYMLSKRKEYIARFTFGKDSDTLDSTGNVVTCGSIPNESDISDILNEFIGDIMQVPPLYSAKSINGKRGYEIARSGGQVTFPPKKVSIYDLQLLGRVSDDTFEIKIECGGGTYIRSLARDMASKLDTKAIMTSLIRTKSGAFSIENSVCTSELNRDNIFDYIIPTDSIINLPSYSVSGNVEKKLLNGISVSTTLNQGDYKLYLSDGSFYGLASSDGECIKAKTKLC